MKVPFCLTTSTRGAPTFASISTPSRVSLATISRLRLELFRRRLGRDLGVRTGRRQGGLVARLRLDEVDYGLGRLHAVGIGEVVLPQVLMRETGELVLVVVHVVEEVDGVAEGAAGLDRLVGAGLSAEAAVHADAEVDLVSHLGQ